MSELALGRGFPSELSDPQEQAGWVELARKTHDGVFKILRTLGKEALADTPSMVDVRSSSFEIHREGPLSEVAPIYSHPLLYVSIEEAQASFPSTRTPAEY